MSFLIVSGLRLARRREIVSLPPEKMRSTATADPIKKKIDINMCVNKAWTGKKTWDGKNVTGKTRKVWKLRASPIPPPNRVTTRKVFLREIPELRKFVDSCPLSLEPCSEILLRGTVRI
jgi:hypothetical protein